MCEKGRVEPLYTCNNTLRLLRHYYKTRHSTFIKLTFLSLLRGYLADSRGYLARKHYQRLLEKKRKEKRVNSAIRIQSGNTCLSMFSGEVNMLDELGFFLRNCNDFFFKFYVTRCHAWCNDSGFSFIHSRTCFPYKETLSAPASFEGQECDHNPSR